MNLVSSSEKQFQHSSAKQLQVMDMVVVEREDPEIDRENTYRSCSVEECQENKTKNIMADIRLFSVSA